MEIREIALQIAKREWGNIRVSLEECGDIGGFDPKSLVDSRLASVGAETEDELHAYNRINRDSLLIKSLIEMDYGLPIYGYLTQESGYVFNALGIVAAERLGLIGELAQAFGSGYSWVRTGQFYPSSLENLFLMPRLLFFKIFFPLGGYFNWDFNSKVVKEKLSLVFHKFTTWQDNPCRYAQDVRDYREQLEPLWRGLSLDLGLANGSKTYRKPKGVGYRA